MTDNKKLLQTIDSQRWITLANGDKVTTEEKDLV